MPRTRLFSRLQAKAEERINSVSASLLRGEIKSYDEYKHWVGYVDGLRDAIKIADEIEGELD